jgi:hypothetical protein
VERERQNIADPSNAAGLAAVVNSAPSGSNYGLVTWNQPSGTQTVSVSNFPGTQTVSGTVAATESGAWNINQTLATPGYEALTDGTHGPVAVKASTTAATATDAALVVAISPNNSVAVTGTFFQGTQPISGTVTANAGTGTFAENLTQVASTSLGATAVVNYGSTPAAVAVPAVNAFITNTPAVTMTSTTVTNTVAVSGTVTANQGTANTAANAWPVEITDGTNVNSVKAASTASASTDKSIVVQLNPIQPNLTTALNVSAAQATAANLNATVVGTGTFATQSVVTQGTASNLNATVVPGGSAIFEVSPTTAANTNANPFFTSVTDGTTKVTVIAGTAALKTDLSSVAGTATVTAASGVQKVGVVGNAAATLDAAINTGAAPTNVLWTAEAPNTVSAGALSAKIISATGALTLVKGSAGNLYGMYFQNTTTTAGFVQYFNAATTGAVTLGTTAEVWAAPIAASATVYIAPGAFALLNFSSGIVYACTTTLGGATTTPALSGTVQYL